MNDLRFREEICVPSNRNKENRKIGIKSGPGKNWGKAKADAMHTKLAKRIDRTTQRTSKRAMAKAERLARQK
jgi:hypothetical protein